MAHHTQQDIIKIIRESDALPLKILSNLKGKQM